MKIRTKLSYQFILITIGIYGLSMLFIYRQFKIHIEEELYSLLESKARMTAEMVLFHEEELQPLPEKKDSGSIQIQDIGNTSIYNENLNRIYTLISSAPNTPSSALKAIMQTGDYRFINQPYKAFGFLYKSKQNKNYIVVSEDIPDYSKLEQLRNILLVSTLFTILIVAFGGWFFAGQSLRPVSRIIHEVKDILPTDLSKRLKPDQHNDELSNLITTFNSLLERIDKAFMTEKSFISNVSHELRNPLAAIRTQIQYAINKKRSPDEYNQILSSLQEDIDEMSQTIEKLLQLARVNSNVGHIPMTPAPVRLDELVYQAQENIYKTHPAYNIKIELLNLPAEEEGMVIEANEPLLKLAFMNLMENACKFSNDNTAKTTVDFSNPQKISVEFQNFGTLINLEDLNKIFQPFYRTTEHKHRKGSGIGLSLVKSIIDIYKIPMEVNSDEAMGNRFTLYFKNPAPSSFVLTDSKVTHYSPLVSKPTSWLLMAFFTFLLTGCLSGDYSQKSDKAITEVIDKWYSQLLTLNRFTDGYRPPVSARTFAYIGLAGWQAGLPAFKNALSLHLQFPDLNMPEYRNVAGYQLEAGLNATYYLLTSMFYPNANMILKSNSKKLYDENLAFFKTYLDSASISASEEYGKSIGHKIFEMSNTDTIGRQAYLYNFDHTYRSPEYLGSWVPTGPDRMPALLPHWGKSKTMLRNVRKINISPPLPYSENQNSESFAQAWELYTLSKSLSLEKKWIAEFWSDDFHGVTYCAASRWISIVLQAMRIRPNLPNETRLELLLKTGFALNDASVLTWELKYRYNTERPETYIHRVIASKWIPLHDNPPFPAYPSGHSVFGAATAVVLEEVFGDKFKMTDYSHEKRKEFLGKPRRFTSFREMANENAISRMYMGVHYRADCEEGLRLGYLIGEEAEKLELWKPGSAYKQ
ncbi:MAG: phosphatase PAP2 family protein [Saprospiraceae bacterium]|nr:phosphatase PAP2 family protein [Saprospiraceae bacterium]